MTAEDLVDALRYTHPGTFRNTARLCLPQPVKDAAAEQVLFQLLRVEIAKSGNSAHKYTPQQKMQGALRCGELLRSRFVRLILLKLFFCRGRL